MMGRAGRRKARVLVALALVLASNAAFASGKGFIRKHPHTAAIIGAAGLTAAVIGADVAKKRAAKLKAQGLDGIEPEGGWLDAAKQQAGKLKGLRGDGVEVGQSGLDNDGWIDAPENATLKNSTTKLKKNLDAADEPKAAGCEAHHIVPQGDNRKFAKNMVEGMHDILSICGIDIDDADNGVYLPDSKSDAHECTGPKHKQLHTKIYYQNVYNALFAAIEGSCDEVRSTLRFLKKELQGNRVPF